MMKHLCKTISIFLCLSLIISCKCFSLTTLAANSADSSIANYDLLIGGTQTFYITDSENNTVEVTVTEEPGYSRLENRTYAVSYKSGIAWEAGYKIVISNNTILRVHSPWYEEYIGTLSGHRLVKNSSLQATYHFNYKYLGITTPRGVRSIISNATLKVTSI